MNSPVGPNPALTRKFAFSLALFFNVWFATVAAPVPSIEPVLEAVAGRRGVCAQLGCGDGALAAQLAERSGLLVHVLEPDEAKVHAARADWQRRGLAGVVTVEHWTAPTLPYADNLINVVIAPDPSFAPEREIRRVLAPGGTAWIAQTAGWRTVAKPWPDEFDEWTHWRHGPDGNMVSRDLAVAAPTGLRWVAGPAQDAGGKRWYYDHVLVSAQGRNFYLHDDGLSARDAFNGALLWTRAFKPATFREAGTAVPAFLQPKARLATRTSKVRPVAIGERLYLAADGRLLALDAATGQTVADFGEARFPRESLVERNYLVVSDTNTVRAFDTATGKLLWKIPLRAERIVAGDGRLFCMADELIVALDLDSGREQWHTVEPAAAPATTCTYHRGVLVLESSSWRDDAEGCGVLVFSGATGRLLWKKTYKPDMTHWKEARAFFAQGLLWLQMEGNKVVGVDPQTGRPRRSVVSRGKHCAAPVATERFFIAPECEFTDLVSGRVARARMFKSACRLPFIPANGLLYSFPVQCECYPMLRGYMALSADKPSKTPHSGRLVKGPAYGRISPAAPSTPGEWPIYRHDHFRSGSTPAALNGSGLRRAWSVRVAQPPADPRAADWAVNPFVRGLLTPPVAGGGNLLVAVPDEHRVAALDAQTGQPRWTFTVGARVDTPPTLHEGLALFGAHDGWVYCLDAATGALVWKFRAAPAEARIMAYGQMESPWPVPGSVLVEGGLAYYAAGRHPMSDGGVRVGALETRTGRLIWETTLTDVGLSNWYSPMLPSKKKVGLDFEPVDLLVKDGPFVSMSRWRFHPRNGDVKLELASTEYQAPGLAVPRGLWSYGIRQTKAVEPRFPAIFDQRQLYLGTNVHAALLMAGGSLISCTTNGVLRVGSGTARLEAPAVHDGLIAAYGRLYVSTHGGEVLCFE